MTGTKIWYITGASKGMGFAVAQQLLIKGHCVAATSRSVSSLEPLFQYGEKFLPLEVDLKKESSIAQSLKTTYEKFGRLDVVVNNAGYGLGGALEELTSEEINDNFEVNFFAVVKVLQQALPYLRDQRSGHIINISSIAGFAPGTGWSMYSATKFAVSGLSEALSNDLKPFGIHVTNVLPGWFRTNFANTDSIAYNKNSIKDYDYIREAHERMNTLNGNQPGDPDEIADVFLEVVNNPAPAVNLFLGSDSFNRAQSKIEQLSQEMSRWKDISFSTDFPG
ncbi:SDR family NAD(P)-dependent oxidoreductase [Chryseobacterium sp. PTM-20240506]|uniref:SDR family NAD(P)-dependent oxidoreductase n=1 Tax=unclassified Chryseobacterium TaxID=2593645 RepID=UPI00279682C6|nr:SDR family NAD(P)-dependent oxidoreductase [Chryseobacterium sp. CKR4-1]MDQ1803666.1 SDR family NAD(P)-dependent oxidoreductase [Chryseobacterium sp. CKR4-1]